MNPEKNEYESFNDAMARILRADPTAVKQAMEDERQANAEKRKATKSKNKEK